MNVDLVWEKVSNAVKKQRLKIMELTENGEDPNELEDFIYEKVSDFKYLISQRMAGQSK